MTNQRKPSRSGKAQRTSRLFAPLLAALLPQASLAAGENPPSEQSEDATTPQNLPNVVMPTWGGKQFWTDRLIDSGHRIQENALTGHYRLLDGRNRRLAWGSFDQCRRKLAELVADDRQGACEESTVILLHGLMRSRSSMASLGEFLAGHGYRVVNVSYASSRASLADHADALASIVRHLDASGEVHFVAHSLGSLVVRRFLAAHLGDDGILGNRIELGRVVMLGPPNRGSQLARRAARLPMFTLVVGPSVDTLIQEESDLPQLDRETCEIGVIAGGRGSEQGFNPFIPGDDDLIVAVEETRLVGASDFLVLPVVHTYMMNDRRVQQQTLQFLRSGRFIE